MQGLIGTTFLHGGINEKKLVLILSCVLYLTGCVTPFIESFKSGKKYDTKWNQQCLTLTQNVDLWKGPKTISFSKNFITAESSKRVPRNLKKRGVLLKGTRLEVMKIYDTYLHGLAGNWHFRVNLNVINGRYKGMEVEIPGIYSAHPYPMFFTHKTQVVPYTARENLQPSTIIFNPEYLTECSR